jgi:hypothetical protein
MTGQWRVTRVLLCGWVLWSGVAAVEKSTSEVGKPDWSIVTAFDEKKDCDSRLRERIASLAERASKKLGYSTAALGDGVEIIEQDGSHGQRWTFICLPGGSDPRPRFRE